MIWTQIQKTFDSFIIAKILYFLDTPCEKTHNVPQRVEMMVMAMAGLERASWWRKYFNYWRDITVQTVQMHSGQQLLRLRHVNIKCPHISCRRKMFSHHSCQDIIWFVFHFCSIFLVINIYTITWKGNCPSSTRAAFFSSIGEEPVPLQSLKTQNIIDILIMSKFKSAFLLSIKNI